jgi:hypothetical protein
MIGVLLGLFDAAPQIRTDKRFEQVEKEGLRFAFLVAFELGGECSEIMEGPFL